MYSGDPNNEHSNIGYIWITNFKFGIQMVRYSGHNLNNELLLAWTILCINKNYVYI